MFLVDARCCDKRFPSDKGAKVNQEQFPHRGIGQCSHAEAHAAAQSPARARLAWPFSVPGLLRIQSVETPV
jgi:hypothetical protein